MKKEEAFLCPFCSAPYRELIPAGTVQVKCRYCGATVLVPPRLGGAVQRCLNHPETLAVGVCNGCAGNYCGDCLFFIKTFAQENTKSGGGRLLGPGYSYFCRRCLREKGLRGDLPTVHMVKEKMSELNGRVAKIKVAMTLEEAESVYRDVFSLWFNAKQWVLADIRQWELQKTTQWRSQKDVDADVEKRMQRGLSRKDAIIEVLTEKGVEIRPGLHIKPTVEDALSEIKKEQQRAMRKKDLNREMSDSDRLYGGLLQLYDKILGGSNGKRVLEDKIKKFMKQGLSREEAIKRLAEKEKIIEKE